MNLIAVLVLRSLPLDPRSTELLRAALRQKASPTVMLAVEPLASAIEALRTFEGVQAVDLGSYDDQSWYTLPPPASRLPRRG